MGHVISIQNEAIVTNLAAETIRLKNCVLDGVSLDCNLLQLESCEMTNTAITGRIGNLNVISIELIGSTTISHATLTGIMHFQSADGGASSLRLAECRVMGRMSGNLKVLEQVSSDFSGCTIADAFMYPWLFVNAAAAPCSADRIKVVRRKALLDTVRMPQWFIQEGYEVITLIDSRSRHYCWFRRADGYVHTISPERGLPMHLRSPIFNRLFNSARKVLNHAT